MTNELVFAYVSDIEFVDGDTLRNRIDAPLLNAANKRCPGGDFRLEWRPHDCPGLAPTDAKRVVLLNG